MIDEEYEIKVKQLFDYIIKLREKSKDSIDDNKRYIEALILCGEKCNFHPDPKDLKKIVENNYSFVRREGV